MDNQSVTRVLLLRCKPHGIAREDQFENGIASIGWPTEASLKDKSRSEVEKILLDEGHEVSSLHVSQIFNFITLPVGSLIMTPSLRNRDIHIFRTLSAYKHDPDRISEGNPHIIEVKLIRTISRDVLSEELQRSLNAARKTATNMTKYSEEVLSILEPSGTIDEGECKSQPTEDTIAEAKEVLKGLLKSNNEEIRLKAAELLLTQHKGI